MPAQYTKYMTESDRSCVTYRPIRTPHTKKSNEFPNTELYGKIELQNKVGVSRRRQLLHTINMYVAYAQRLTYAQATRGEVRRDGMCISL